MDIINYRTKLGLTQEEVAGALGFKRGSKGYFSRLERGLEAWPLRLALQVERWSAGAVTAASLVSPADRDLLADFVARSRAPEPERAGA